MNKKDLLIISYLRRNARITLTNISKKTSIAVSTIYDKIKDFEQSLITKHTAILNFNRLGFTTRAIITLSVDKNSREEASQYLRKNGAINTVYKINNGYDFMVEGVFRSIKEAEDLLENMDSRFRIKKRQVYYIIDDIKKEEFMSDPALVDLFSCDG
ncbi:winged helix-turn-helix transcriptional regulator [Candidatus Woesearchaeota archaeon]|nr:winged helix-turn-helix transcriptional regulator [Candidatus Woesearchaeota archaeon]